MMAPHDLETHLIAEYRRARIAFYIDPQNFGAWMDYDLAGEDLAAHLREHGTAEDWDNRTRYELDRNGEVQEMPLGFRDWPFIHGRSAIFARPALT